MNSFVYRFVFKTQYSRIYLMKVRMRYLIMRQAVRQFGIVSVYFPRAVGGDIFMKMMRCLIYYAALNVY